MKHKLIKLLSVFSLIMCMLIACIPVSVLAVEVEEEALSESIKEGFVIPEDAIYLSSEEDLLAFVEDCRLDTWSDGKVVVLKNDIELLSTKFQGIPTFAGVFMGQGYTISGLYIEEEGSTMGFFRYLQKTAIVMDLTLEGCVKPEGSACVVGGLVGENGGKILNCTFSGTVAGIEQIGGIAGNNKTTGLIENCKVTGDVYGNHFIGGIVGENHGVIRICENQAEINIKSMQNKLSVEDITMDSLVNTEVSNTATDIGGIAGISSGVIRKCVNKGAVGYKNMGYNIGGIAGSQKGYLVDCINYADIQGRKEVGGIVGQMEPNIVLDYDTDSLQILNSQLNSIEKSLNNVEADLNDSEVNAQMDGLQSDLNDVQSALDAMESSNSTPEFDNWEEFENWNTQEDQNTAARNDLSDALNRVYTRSESIANSTSDTSQQLVDEMKDIVSELNNVVNTMSSLESNLGYSIEDISGEDAIEDTIGKVANCENYGYVKGDLNIGGIAGIIAKENDLDEYQDTDTTGKESLHATYETRAVVRGCRNMATVTANKQNVGGIAGQMIMGAVIECINTGNIDALNADKVGGIAGDSYTIIRDCGSRAIISGDTYVGGIAGNGNEVTGCYAFTDIKAYTEKGGAILGDVAKLSTVFDEEDALVSKNYYYLAGRDIGGIDGISYEGAADKLALEDFLALEYLDEAFRTVNVRFRVEDKEDVLITVAVGDTISTERVPVLSTENATECAWEVVPAVASETLGMGETAVVEYLSEESLTNIMFDQTYEATFDAKGTVVKGSEKNANNLAVILGGGIFARNTTIEMTDLLATETKVDGKNPIIHWQIALSNSGVDTLHYLIPEDVDTEQVKLFVKGTTENWVERDFTVDGSYMVFDFTDEDTEFALVLDYMAIGMDILLFVFLIGIGIAAIVTVLKLRKKKVNT